MPPNGKGRLSSRARDKASVSGHGVHYTSPLRKKDSRHKTLVRAPGAARASAQLRANLSAMLKPPPAQTPQPPQAIPTDIQEPEDIEMPEWVEDSPPALQRIPIPAGARHRLPATKRRQESWDALLPLLEEPLAYYQQATYGQRPPTISVLVQHECTTFCGQAVTASVQCLYVSHVEQVQVATCACMPVAAVLVRHGVFPMSPSTHRTAVSIDLLEVYRALFERSCDAITALAAALHTIYDRRGFRVVSQRNPALVAKDPFRAGLSQAVQSYSNLRTCMEARLNAALSAASNILFPPTPLMEASQNPNATEATDATEAIDADTPLPNTGENSSVPNTNPPAPTFEPDPAIPEAPRLTPGRADRILRNRCPTCFATTKWGRPFSEGGDVQLGSDGCFSYRHLRSAGDGPISYDPSYFVSKEKVDAVRDCIAAARSQKPAEFTPPIPKEAIDACANSWDAANEKKVDPKRHDASGIFVMTCRHSQVLFLCNIDTPEATVVQCYDVACVTEHSVNLYPILKEGYCERISFVINAMHAYSHQWICQLVYSPRLRRGIGLTDAEGVERFWSQIRKLIGITRNQWHSRCIWMIDQYAAFVNTEGRDNLGDWIIRQHTKNLPRKQAAAEKILRDCGIPDAELRQNWEEQKAAQTSVQSHAPVRLRRKLDKVLSLQGQIDIVEQSIADAKKSITSSDASPDSLVLLRGLEATHDTLSAQAEALYASLNIQKAFPELQNLPLEFVRTLLIMRDLKINIRSRAVGSFHEWETLDRAVGGWREALGTKLHQSTRKAITKRQPALLKAIGKFNDYCADLERLRPAGCQIPIPEPLSTQLNGLRDDPSLHEDVWITPSQGSIPRWLDDSDVRDGIRVMHSSDRCREEAERLNLERANMRDWLKDESDIVALAVTRCTDSALDFYLQRTQEDIEFLKTSWAPALQHCPILPVHPIAEVASAASQNPSRNAPQLPATPMASETSAADTRSHTVTVAFEPDDDFFDKGDIGPASEANDMIVAAEELDPGLLSDGEDTILVNEVVMAADGDEDTSGVDACRVKLDIRWQMPGSLTVDTMLLHAIYNRNRSLDVHQERKTHTVVGHRRWPTLKIEPTDLDRVTSQTGRLNCFVLNGLAASFLGVFGHPYSPNCETANQCAVFSTYDLTRVHYKKGDANLWSATKHTEYWDKPLWLIPVHRPTEEHWVLVVASVREQELFFFDSLARKSGWRKDLHDTMVLITQLVALANRNQHPLHISTEEDAWVANPLFTLARH
ncbi:hypothetical protein C8R43DRAFT_1137360 [Mycena crocata]|nr:hypothetical protein C8R43DRAFT_1137360 [Mycena crocata]